MDVIKIVLTSLLSVAALFLIAKLMGHKQVAQLDFFDYISGITIGSVAAELAIDLEEPWRPLITLAIYGAISVALSWVAREFPKTRKYINGSPTVLMREGRIYRDNLKSAKLDLSEFLLLCREQGYFDLDEIQTAIFEHNGKLSILPKPEARPLEPADLDLPVDGDSVGVELIMDGRTVSNNLTRVGRDERWLDKKLKECGFKNAAAVFLGIYYPTGDRLLLFPMDAGKGGDKAPS